MTWLRRNVFGILDILKFAGIILLVFMFIHFNTVVATQARRTQTIAANTNSLVNSQGDILKAIKQVTTDGNLTSAQQTAIIICMLQVPVQDRTTNLQTQCRSQSTSVAPANSTNASAPQQPSSKVFVSLPPSQPSQPTSSSPNKQPAPKPTKPLVCSLTLGLLGCLN